jgi:hypothetical protein
MKNVKLENAAAESVSRALQGITMGIDLVNIIKFQNRETEDLSVYDAVILLSLSVEYN